MSCYLSMYGKPFPNALKRGVADAMQRFDEYQLAKYNGGNKSLKFKDVLRITHPSPKNKEIETLFGKVLNDTLETPYTWEVELSTRGNTKEVWNELIASGKVGYMALLRNLRNIVKCGADVAPVLAKLSNPKEIKKSRQMPFRFYSAYVELKKAGMMTPDIHEALEKAITLSTGNMPMMKGRTLIAIDTSGSMSSRISAKSNVTCGEIGVLLGALATRMCEDATVCYFNSAGWGWSSSNQKGYRIERYGKYDSILDICEKNSRMSGGTDLRLPLEWALNENAYKPFDRIIYLSDNECNVSRWGNGIKSCQGLIDQYRGLKNQNVWVHAIDLEGYGTQQFCGKNFNVVAGWNERVLEFISLAENGMGNLVQYIENYGKELRD